MFNIKLKELRKKKNLSQSTLADRLNVSQTAYGKWEIGTREPNIETIKFLANYFDVSIDYLLDNDTPIYNEALELNKAMTTVDSSTRKRMVDTLKSAFPFAFDEYEWALGVLKEQNAQVYSMLKEGKSELSKNDIINMAKAIKGEK